MNISKKIKITLFLIGIKKLATNEIFPIRKKVIIGKKYSMLIPKKFLISFLLLKSLKKINKPLPMKNIKL